MLTGEKREKQADDTKNGEKESLSEEANETVRNHTKK